MKEKQAQTAELAGRLQALSPLSVLARGFTLAEKKEHGAKTLIGSAADLSPGDIFLLRFSDGEAVCRAESVERKEKEGGNENAGEKNDL